MNKKLTIGFWKTYGLAYLLVLVGMFAIAISGKIAFFVYMFLLWPVFMALLYSFFSKKFSAPLIKLLWLVPIILMLYEFSFFVITKWMPVLGWSDINFASLGGLVYFTAQFLFIGGLLYLFAFINHKFR
ncbi:MAG: hypothetical protein UT21_C0003G0018 [Candidatus Woesebacteria bacterium GW2011_GWA1_39_11b]|nr:MAG: hypothetical protein UT21_C0003G0018 [Candidatus Woesebacteria bacterium GW2011_GWA1_39_11b]